MTRQLRFTVLATAVLAPACFEGESELVIDDHPIGETIEYRAEPDSLVHYRGLTFAVPELPGEGVGTVADGDDTWYELELENTGDGYVAIRVVDPTLEPAGDELAAAALGQCDDPAFRTHHRWGTRLDWFLNPAGIPAGFDVKAEAALQRAAQNIVVSRNSCGFADQVSATHSYRGRTSGSVGITSTASCSGRTNRSVVGFRTLPSQFNAVTCWYWGASQLLEEIDIAFNLDRPWATDSTVASNCVNQAHLEGIATHEFGHAFGLLHPSGSHPTLTMDPTTPRCDATDRTLGRGDVRGLRSLY